MEGKKYSLLIADDDDAIRNGMSHYIDWDSMGFYVAADFEDGKELIDYLKENHADAVLTDIQMAEVSGLQVAKYIYENQPDTRVVILSGYKEFDYARQAIAYNVEDYLLKPVNLDELGKLFARIYQSLEEERRKKEAQERDSREFSEIMPELQEQFWMSILLGLSGNREKIIERREALGLSFSTRVPCAVMKVDLQIDEDSSQYYYLENASRYNLIRNIFSGEKSGLQYYPVYTAPGNLKMVVVSDKAAGKDEFERRLESLDSSGYRGAAALLGLRIDVSLEKSFFCMEELTEYYSRGDRTGKENSGAEDGAAQEQLPFQTEKMADVYKLMMGKIDSDDPAELDFLVSTLFFEMRQEPLESVKTVILDFFSLLQARFMKTDPETWADARGKIDFVKLSSAKDRDEMKRACLDMLHALMESAGRRREDMSRSLIDKIKLYLSDHYAEDVSLDTLSEKYYVSSSYLSRLFRQETGITITEYLTDIRIRKSKELLIAGKYHSYEISRMVGYRSDKYFFRVFRQATGMSPSEYRRSQAK